MCLENFESFIECCNTFLLDNSGLIGQIIQEKLFDEYRRPGKAAFFKPYESKADPLFRATSIMTSPVCLFIIALEFFVIAICAALKDLQDLCTDNMHDASEPCGTTIGGLVMVIITLCGAIVSPIVNLIDLLGGAVMTIAENHTGEENILSV